MTRVEFDKKLAKIDFTSGINNNLENFLLACLSQLELYKHKAPSYEIFLKILTDARNGQKVDFDMSWRNLSVKINDMNDSELDDSTKWNNILNEIRSLIFDLVNTKIIRSQSRDSEDKMLFEWETEGGIKFYNGITPSSILGYAATRFEGEYPPSSYQEREVSWEEFTWPFWIGISYE